MPTLSDARFDALRVLVPLAPPTTNDMLFAWLRANGGTGNTLGDLWYTYFISEGVTPGHRNDMVRAYLTAQGFAQPHLNDAWLAFWVAGGTGGGAGPVGDDVDTFSLQQGPENWPDGGAGSRGVWVTPDGLYICHGDTVFNNIYSSVMSPAFDLTSLASDTVAGELDPNPFGMYMRPDGMRLFNMPVNGVTYVDLATPFDLSTKGANVTFGLAGGNIRQGITFSNDGFEMYIGRTDEQIEQYTLATAWLPSSSTGSVLLDISGNVLNGSQGIDFDASGTRFYCNTSTNLIITQWNLSVPWDITSALYETEVNLGVGQIFGLHFDRGNGDKLFFVIANQNDVYKAGV